MTFSSGRWGPIKNWYCVAYSAKEYRGCTKYNFSDPCRVGHGTDSKVTHAYRLQAPPPPCIKQAPTVAAYTSAMPKWVFVIFYKVYLLLLATPPGPRCRQFSQYLPSPFMLLTATLMRGGATMMQTATAVMVMKAKIKLLRLCFVLY